MLTWRAQLRPEPVEGPPAGRTGVTKRTAELATVLRKARLTLRTKLRPEPVEGPPAVGSARCSLDMGRRRRLWDEGLDGVELGGEALLPAPEGRSGEGAGGACEALAPRRVAGEVGEGVGDGRRVARRQKDAGLVVADEIARVALVGGEGAAGGGPPPRGG